MRALLLAILFCASTASGLSWSDGVSSALSALLGDFRERPIAGGAPAPASSSPIDRQPLLWRGAATAQTTSSLAVADPFDRAVVSWNADGPVLVELEAGGAWHVMGRWSAAPRSQPGDPAVDVDTLKLPAPATSIRWRVTPELGTTVRLVAVTRWLDGARIADAAARSPAWGVTLNVPQRSQGAERVDPARICSPTSLSMVLAFHGTVRTVAEVAAAVRDRAADVYGNWPFNTAYAAQAAGLEAYVARAGFEELEQEIAAGRPAIISHHWAAGELTGAPINATDGHVIVVVGFTATGDVVVNDPAGRTGSVRRVYQRAQLRRTWLEKGRGIAYFLRPRA